ncbi:MAG: hypothetical protein ACK4Q5_13730 [Saprospiraceae bacterium]
MRIQKLIFTAFLAVLAAGLAAKPPADRIRKKPSKAATYRAECANSESQIDQEINNVRARLLGGGDCWWDLNDGSYIVPKVDPASGQRPVSSIFAGSVWLGGVDPAGNLKLAAEDYRNNGQADFWPGPLTPDGLTDAAVCKNWDRHFRVVGEEIRAHLANLADGNKNPDIIPRALKGWPARGNPYFEEVWGFELPDNQQGLAGFYDANGDFRYNPVDGDYPSIDIKGCPLDRYPDEMIFWIYNDHGGGQAHDTGGKAIQMEVQVQAFGYVTNDELNDMTFQRYKLINRAKESIDSTFFAMWVDADLGCADDDYIGCDTAKSLMYIYNQDNLDGNSGCTCGDVATYCDKVPILGVDYFRGPQRQVLLKDIEGNDSLAEIELGMSSFTYYNNGSIGPQLPPTTDPGVDFEFYNYITGSWRTGVPFTYGGSGYTTDPTAQQIKYAFTEPPSDPNGWSMCTANLPFGDRRTLQASGPFKLNPGAVNELIIGIPWVPDIDYPCPDVEQLFRADKLAQGLFDNCFELLDGPDAPFVDWVELNNQVVAVLTNPKGKSNNYKEGYAQADFLAPDNVKGTGLDTFRFEGYKIYQLANPNVSSADFENPEVSRLIYQVDVKNRVSKLYNWEEIEGPVAGTKYYTPVLEVEGQNEGIRHTFSITEDQFAKGNDKRLINHKKYYFSAIAYGYNEFAPFNYQVTPVTGQQRPYLPGRRNIQIYTVIPRPIVDQELNSVYGEGVVITRLEGQGAGHNFLDLSDESREAVIGSSFDSTLTYRPGRGPISVQIFNPFEVKDGEYELSIVDGDLTDNKVDANATWILRNVATGDTVASDRSIAQLNEQILEQYGFTVTVAQTADIADADTSAIQLIGAENGGALGIELEYADPNNQWLEGARDFDEGVQDFIRTEKLDRDEALDRNQGLSRMGYFYPYPLCSALQGDPATDQWFITPMWTERFTGSIGNLSMQSVGGSINNRRARMRSNPGNIDIVLTSDKSKWSRCVVAEMAPYTFTSGQYPQDPNYLPESPTGTGAKMRASFDVRYSPSVGKDDANGDGLPDPDGAVDAAGKPILGMGWFPGYAIDVETGRRLNVFFGENSAINNQFDPRYTGRDMLWNPTDQVLRTNEQIFQLQPYDIIAGGYHWIYVMNSDYDECEQLRLKLTPEITAGTAKGQQLGKIAWAGMVLMNTGFEMKSLKDGLIPNDVRIKIRTDNPYQTWYNENDPNPDPKKRWNGHPKYRFKIEGRQAQQLDAVQVENALDSIKVTPNPYYGYSQYEANAFQNIVKITNLPGKCTVTIYSIDGKFIRQYTRNEQYGPYKQIAPDVEWDLKNARGIPVSSGVYLININAPGMGERTIKWFGIARQFDPSGL